MAAASEIVKIRDQARREMRDPTDLRGEKLGIREKVGAARGCAALRQHQAAFISLESIE
jgi:hypothetical protein